MYRCLDDGDDEVRDRAALYLRTFKEKPLADAYVKDGAFWAWLPSWTNNLRVPIDSVFSLAALESKLVAYVKDPEAAALPLDISTVPKISRAQAAAESARTFSEEFAFTLD